MSMAFNTDQEKRLYELGKSDGKKDMEDKLILAAENGTPIELEGRAWFLKSDIQNLRDIFEDIENEENDKSE
ncbi:MAG: hypothetical protein PHW34_07645 [Hespellia sp.]|nr:hypothetical protein [Hespellia sp.]